MSCQLVQITGSLLILAAFAAAQFGILDQSSYRYLVPNAAGSAVLAVTAVADHQWGFVLLEGVWALVSVVSTVRHWLTAPRPRATMETMETEIVSSVSEDPRTEVILDAASQLFLAPGPGRVSMDELARDLGMSKKTIYRHFPDKHSLMTAVLDRQFGAIERLLSEAAEETAGKPFGEQVERFLIAACGELGRIGAPQLATGRGDAVLRKHVEQRMDTVVYQRLDALFQDGHRRGLLRARPELLSEITRGAVERLLNSQLPQQLGRSAAELLQEAIDTVLYGAIRAERDSQHSHKQQEAGS